MKRLWPGSLFSQVLLMLLVGFAISQGAGWWFYSADRERAVQAVGGFAVAQRVANLAKLMRDAPPEWRERLAQATSDDTFRVQLSLGPVSLPASTDSVAGEVIAQYLAEELGDRLGASFRVAVAPPAAGFGPPFGVGPGPMMGRGPMALHHLGAYRDLQVALPLGERQWLGVTTSLPDTGPAFSSQFMISMALMALILVAVGAFAARRVTAPLASFAAAAERLGRDMTAPSLPESGGSLETEQAAKAFNRMQRNLRAFVDNRTGLLGAISHDLRTPLTLLRLRAEQLDAAPDREKMLATILEMEAMISATLDFAKGAAITEPRRPTDLGALLQAVIDDMADAGLPVTLVTAPKPEQEQSLVVECRPAALKRVLVNVLDNAVKHGNAARAAIAIEPKALVITIDDDGPGIPDAEIERVFEPFFRLDPSRSRGSGGYGLGLAIARAIVMAEGGTLGLSNLPGGGLRAQLRLPR